MWTVRGALHPVETGESLVGRYGRLGRKFKPNVHHPTPTYEDIHRYDTLEDVRMVKRKGSYATQAQKRARYQNKINRMGRGYFRKSGYYGRFGSQISRGVGVKREAKFFDTAKGESLISSTGEIYSPSLNLVPAGSNENQRVGRLIIIKQLNIRFLTKVPTSADVGTGGWLRLIVYCDKQTNGATAAVTDLLETTTFLTYSNLANSSRFKILWSKNIEHNILAAAGNGTANDHATHNMYTLMSLPMNLQIDFEGATGAITELCCNNIGVLAFSQVGNINMIMMCRIRYFD